MTRRTNKFSLGVKIASVLTCLALTAVGFASWLVIRPVEEKHTDGSFTIYEVEENDVTITVELKVGSSSDIVWGHDGSTQTNPWLVTGSDVQQQNLTTTFVVTVESKQGENAGINLDEIISSVDVAFKMSDAASYDAAKEAGYVANPTITIDGTAANNYDEAAGTASGSTIVDADAATMSFEVTVTFAWGANGNPYTYYNTLECTDENADNAIACLEAIELLSSDTFTLTISTTSVSAN